MLAVYVWYRSIEASRLTGTIGKANPTPPRSRRSRRRLKDPTSVANFLKTVGLTEAMSAIKNPSLRFTLLCFVKKEKGFRKNYKKFLLVFGLLVKQFVHLLDLLDQVLDYL